MRDIIRFRFAPAKAKAAIRLMLDQQQSIDLHALLKACYFADKSHLNKHRRPIFGATYRAMKFGPVPLEIYEMAKGESLWLAEMKSDKFPWQITGYHIRLIDNEPVDLKSLSRTDQTEVLAGFAKSIGMNFNERTAATHGADWEAANLGIMRYEDMIDEGPNKSALIDYLRETGPVMKL